MMLIRQRNVTTYRHQEENDDLLVYVSLTPIETTKQSAKLDGPPLKVYARQPRIRSDLDRKPSTQLKDAPIDAPNDAPNDVSNDAPNDVSNDVLLVHPVRHVVNVLVDIRFLHMFLMMGYLLPLVPLYPVSAFVSYDGLSTSSRAFVANLDSILVPKIVGEALAYFGWRAAMIEEMNALDHNDLLDDAGQIEAKSYDEPMIPKLKLRSKDVRLLHNPEKYRRAVGKLNYLTITHPDIAFPVSVVSQFLTAPRTSHWDALTQILGYLKGTSRLGILYANHGHHIAKGFIDADYAGCPNTSRFTTGYYVFVGGNLVSWKRAGKGLKKRKLIEITIALRMWSMKKVKELTKTEVDDVDEGFKKDNDMEVDDEEDVECNSEEGNLSDEDREDEKWVKDGGIGETKVRDSFEEDSVSSNAKVAVEEEKSLSIDFEKVLGDKNNNGVDMNAETKKHEDFVLTKKVLSGGIKEHSGPVVGKEMLSGPIKNLGPIEGVKEIMKLIGVLWILADDEKKKGWKKEWVKNIIKNELPDVIGLQETKSGLIDDVWIEDIWGSKGYGNSQLPTIGNSLGILLNWDSRIFNYNEVVGDERFIAVKGSWKGKGKEEVSRDSNVGGWRLTRVSDDGLKFSKLDRFLLNDEFNNLWERSTWLEARKMWDDAEKDYCNMLRQKSRISNGIEKISSEDVRLLENSFDKKEVWDAVRGCDIMKKIGFRNKWCNWVDACLRSSFLLILVNVSPSEEFGLERGFRQGDPLSLFLFILAEDGINAIVNETVEKGIFGDVAIRVNNITVSRLQYADDTIF
nr:hypothetical protein [Tanacetum cinerariifolium]